MAIPAAPTPLPRTADEIAQKADFFSFGANDLKVGIRRKHGDPKSTYFRHKVGMDFVSPFRLPIARLATGRADGYVARP